MSATCHIFLFLGIHLVTCHVIGLFGHPWSVLHSDFSLTALKNIWFQVPLLVSGLCAIYGHQGLD